MPMSYYSNSKLDITKTHKVNDHIEKLESSLTAREIPIRFNCYKVADSFNNMTKSKTITISSAGLTFLSTKAFELGSLIRIYVELPDFWQRKSSLVQYAQTEIPTYFQILARLVKIYELGNTGTLFQFLGETVNIDGIDKQVLENYL